jgi:hypothetical protein
MVNEPVFADQRAERRLTGHGLLQRQAVGLTLLGMGFIVMGFVSGNEYPLTVGSFCVAAGGAWRLCLS